MTGNISAVSGCRLGWWAVALCTLYAGSMAWLQKGLAVDTAVSGFFFSSPCAAADPRSCWLLDKNDARLTFFLHDLPVHVIGCIALTALVLWCLGFLKSRFRKYREGAFITLIAIALFPGLVSLMKHYTGHFCPGQLDMYGGPVGQGGSHGMRPRCFPAGFPSPAFGLVIFYFSGLPVFWRRAGLMAGLGLGTIFSIIQIARGEHFLSHNIATLCSALFIGGLVYLFNEYRMRHRIAPVGD